MDIETSVIINSTSTEHEQYVITTSDEQLTISLNLSSGQKVLEMNFNNFNREYFERVKNVICPLLQTVISNLIRSRDYLGLQLNLEFGNIDEKEYEQLELAFLVEQSEVDPENLKNDINMLINLSNRVYNSEEIATMFNCSVDKAEKALNILLLGKESIDGYISNER